MRSSCGVIVAAFLLMGVAASAHAADPAYFTRYDDLRMTRDKGVLVVEMNNHGSALKFTAHDHETFVDAFYDIGRDRDNKAVILTGAGGDWMEISTLEASAMWLILTSGPKCTTKASRLCKISRTSGCR